MYRVQYTEVASGVIQSKDVTGEWNVRNAETSLTELTPSTSYSIQVAAVNEEGDVGLYSEPFTKRTSQYNDYQNFKCTRCSSSNVMDITFFISYCSPH